MAKIFKAAKGSSLVGKTINVDIERLDANGVGVGKYQKQSVFIEHCLAGERVSAKVLEQNSKRIKAKPLKVTKVSNDRVKPLCQHYYQCGGCDLQHFSHQAQLTFKRKKVTELFARQGIQSLEWQPSVYADEKQYRRKARLGVQYNKLGQHILGFRMKGSNTLTSIKSCPILTEPLKDIFTEINKVLTAQACPNAIGHIEVIDADKVTLTVRQLSPITDEEQSLWRALGQSKDWRILIDDGTRVFNVNDEGQLLSYQLDEVAVTFQSNNFIQVNSKVNDAMINLAIEWLALKNEDKVLDLFCGLGNFSLPIAQVVKQVTGVEGVDSMVEQAASNAKLNGIDNARFYQLDLNSSWLEQSWYKQSFNKVILDPARAGAYQACEQLLAIKPELVLYVSCDPASLALDASVLVSGGYQIKKITLIDMFTHTKHVETMVLFERITA